MADRVTEPFKQTDEADAVAAMEGAGLIMMVNGTFTDSQPLPGEATFTRILKSYVPAAIDAGIEMLTVPLPELNVLDAFETLLKPPIARVPGVMLYCVGLLVVLE